jgi:hypothetical protein
MSPPTNGATSLGFLSMPAGLPDALLFPFDGFSADDYFFATAPPPPPPILPPGADPHRLLLLPSSSCNNNDVQVHGTAPEALAVAAPTSSVVTSTVATSRSSSAPPSPSPSLPLMANPGHRTSCYRGVTRYALLSE